MIGRGKIIRELETRAGTVRVGDTLYWRWGRLRCAVVGFQVQELPGEYPEGTELVCCRYMDREGAVRYFSAPPGEFDRVTVTRVPLV